MSCNRRQHSLRLKTKENAVLSLISDFLRWLPKKCRSIERKPRKLVKTVRAWSSNKEPAHSETAQKPETWRTCASISMYDSLSFLDQNRESLDRFSSTVGWAIILRVFTNFAGISTTTWGDKAATSVTTFHLPLTTFSWWAARRAVRSVCALLRHSARATTRYACSQPRSHISNRKRKRRKKRKCRPSSK